MMALLLSLFILTLQTGKICIPLSPIELVRGKTNNLGSDQVRYKPDCIITARMLEFCNFGFKKKRDCTIRVAKPKALISFAVTSKLVCVFVFAYADIWFSHAAAFTECSAPGI